MPYVVDGGFGVYTSNKPKVIADTVFKWFDDKKLLDSLSRKAKQLSHPDATRCIARDLGEIVLRNTVEIPRFIDKA